MHHLSKFGEFMVSNNLYIGSAPNTLTMLCRKHACSINFPQLCLFEPKMSMMVNSLNIRNKESFQPHLEQYNKLFSTQLPLIPVTQLASSSFLLIIIILFIKYICES